MKHVGLIKMSLLAVMGGILIYFGIYFYEKGTVALNHQAKVAFEKALEMELVHKKMRVDSLRVLSQSHSSTIQQMPKIVSMTINADEEQYKVTAEQHRQNIAKDAVLRMSHSLALRKSPIVLDSLNAIWRETLTALSLPDKTALCMTTTDRRGRITSQATADYDSFVSLPSLFSCTLGYGCEIKIIGFFDSPWWFVLGRYVLVYLLLLSVVCALVYFFVVYLIRITHRPPTIEIKEVIVPQLVIDVPKEEAHIYQLKENVIYYAEQRLLVVDGKERTLRVQASAIFELLLNAEDHKLSDAAIMDRLWPDGMGNYDSFQQALRRVRDDVGKESLIELKRAEPGIYKLYI